jgi:BirA family biotin operon repressor/biotin-[acetyl-CoA-carboxylase] ligase
VEARLPELDVGLKWPNDVVLGRRKVAGVLCEGHGGQDTVLVGVGVNVRQRPGDFPPPIRSRAVSLEMAAGREVSRAALLGEIVGRIRDLMDPPAARLTGDLAREVSSRDRLRGHPVLTHGDRPGVARGIAPDGALRVEREGGEVERVRAGSVRRLSGGPGR